MGENDGIPKTPEWGETITGIPADTIRELAIRYAPQNQLPLSRDMAPREMHMGSKVPVALSFLPVLQEM
jgi:dmsA_ynfE: anaerobic dimethyl sulfoxide reductase, A subunit, DmsA/YnfE family